ncbi:MAG: hypothetical protein IGBAC_0640 [Ignavibacteriae bacterium]|nr:MAG: hypothetical protein IGBAC_0640 [Ignavibacteriota bacterium]
MRDKKNNFINTKPENVEFEVGEELVYNVSYLFLNLGEIKIKVIDKIVEPDRTVYKTIAYIDSYRGIPFVSLHEVYESIFDQKLYSYWFRELIKSGSNIDFITFNYDYPNKRVIFESGDFLKNIVKEKDTLQIDTLSQDGLSLFFLARAYLFSNDTIIAPTIMIGKKGSAVINFYGQRKSVKIKSIDYPVDVVEFSGNANFVGVYGFTGGFEGWFSNDEARVPIMAKLKVLIGKVKVELTQWKKKNWIPPRYKEN